VTPPRLPVAARRRIICVVIVLAAATLAVEVLATGRVTFAGPVFPAISIASGLLYLWSTRRRP
jgi:hypothetical protein